jgi:thioredoxin 1
MKKMKRITLIAAGIIMIIVVASQSLTMATNEVKTSGVQFNTSTWEQVLAIAKKENKPIFLDVSASWCGYCKRMKADVYTDVEVANYYNSNFINVSVDAEIGEGIDLKKKYGVKGYPTHIFINPDGSVAIQSAGFKNKNELIKTGKNAIAK